MRSAASSATRAHARAGGYETVAAFDGWSAHAASVPAATDGDEDSSDELLPPSPLEQEAASLASSAAAAIAAAGPDPPPSPLPSRSSRHTPAHRARGVSGARRTQIVARGSAPPGSDGGGDGSSLPPSTPAAVVRRGAQRWAAGAVFSAWGALGTSDWGRELQSLLPMAAPVVASSCLTQLLNVLDLLIIGNVLGTEYLAAAALGNCVFNLLSAFILGGAAGVDELYTDAIASGGGGGKGGVPLHPSPPLPGSKDDVESTAAGVAVTDDDAAGLMLVSTASGAAIAVLEQRGLVLMVIATLPVAVGLFGTQWFLEAIGGQDIELSETAAGYCDSLLLGLLPLACSTALGGYLAAQRQVWAVVAISLAANVLNLTLNVLLIEVEGFLGAPLATSVARVVHLLMLIIFMVRHRRKRGGGGGGGGGSTPTPSVVGGEDAGGKAVAPAPSAPPLRGPVSDVGAGEACPIPSYGVLCDARGVLPMVSAMMRCSLVVALESWPLEVSVLLAGLIDVPSIDAHCVILNLCLFVSLGAPTGFGVAASARVPALLAAGDAAGAQRAAHVAVGASLVYACVAACGLLILRFHLGALFTPSEEVASLCASATLIAAPYVIVDGFACALGGVLRGLGWGRQVTGLTFLGWVGVGLPIASRLAFAVVDPSTLGSDELSSGLLGLWGGLLAGVCATSIALVALFRSVDWTREAANAAAAATAAVVAAEAEAAEAMALMGHAEEGGGVPVGAGTGLAGEAPDGANATEVLIIADSFAKSGNGLGGGRRKLSLRDSLASSPAVTPGVDGSNREEH